MAEMRMVKAISAMLILMSIFVFATGAACEMIWGVYGSVHNWYPPTVDVVVVPDPEASYNFNDGAFAFIDKTGNGHTGSCSTCPVHGATDGPDSDGAYTWAGVDEVVTFEASAPAMDLHSNNAFTITYQISGTMSLLQNLFNRVGQFTQGGALGTNGITHKLTDPCCSNKLVVSSGHGSGTWYDLAFVFDGAGDTIKFYRDGTLITTTSGVTGVALAANSVDITFSSTGFSDYVGLIDNARFFNTALDQPQVNALVGVSVPEP